MEYTDSRKWDRGGADWLKEGVGISQKTNMKDSWTWPTVRGLTVQVEVGWVEGGGEEKLG